jgi:hypothetical protein
MLTREQKQEQIDALKGSLGPAQGLFVMDFTGLTVGEVTELRRKVKEADGGYVVVKNTLAKLALSGSANEAVGGLLDGPSASPRRWRTSRRRTTSCASAAASSAGSSSIRSRRSRSRRCLRSRSS